MKRVLSFLLVAATAVVVAGCLREQALMHDSPRISIRAYIPEEPLSHLAWQENDIFRVINRTVPFTTNCPTSFAPADEAKSIKPSFSPSLITMCKQETNAKQPYTSPLVSVIILSHEQDIATGSSSILLEDMDAVDIFDDSFI